jgi:hypothetical protein
VPVTNQPQRTFSPGRSSARYPALALRPLTAVLLRLAALATLSCSACEKSAEPEAQGMTSPFDPERPEDRLAPPPERSPLGTWAALDDYRMRVLSTQDCEVEEYFAPAPGHKKIGVLVEIEGRTRNHVPVNALHAALTDSNNRTYQPTLAGCRPALPAGRLQQGEKAQGYVTFEIPASSSGLRFQYDPVIIGRASAILRFDLER